MFLYGVLMHEFSFGQLNTFFNVLKPNCQNKIIRHCNAILKSNNNNNPTLIQIHHFITILNNIVHVRNLVAHNKKMLGYKNRYNLPTIPHFISSGRTSNTIYETLIYLKIFLNTQQYAQMHNTILKRIKNLAEKLKVININHIISQLVFPNDWHLTTTKIPQ